LKDFVAAALDAHQTPATSDQGIGIKTVHLPKIFEPFFTIASKSARRIVRF